MSRRGDNQCCGDRLFQYLVRLPVSIDTLCTESSKVCLQHCFSTKEALAAFRDGGVSWYAVLTSVPYESLIASCTKNSKRSLSVGHGEPLRHLQYVTVKGAYCQDDKGMMTQEELGLEHRRQSNLVQPVQHHLLRFWRVQYFDSMCVRILHTLF